jgi:hypothetical protein
VGNVAHGVGKQRRIEVDLPFLFAYACQKPVC